MVARGVGGALIPSGHSSPTDTPIAYRDLCGKCGARRVDAQLGLEATPEAYVAKMVAVFREVRRVLRDDGTAWINLGDCYNSSPSNQLNSRDWGDGCSRRGNDQQRQKRDVAGLKPKDLVGIPWRVAFALQADGWYLRSDIIWHKNNPMPESVTDRPTKAHEYVFLLSKQERYFWDAEAVREKSNGDSGWAKQRANGQNTWQYNDTPERIAATGQRIESSTLGDPAGRNIRSVWTIPSEAYIGSHFATFPRKLVEPCIRAGTSQKGACPTCGKPWERELEAIGKEPSGHPRGPNAAYCAERAINGAMPMRTINRDLGFRPACTCFPSEIPIEQVREAWPVPCTVFDPFAGSGTTGVVALALGRRFIGCDLSAKYLHMAERRISRPHAPVPRMNGHEPLPLFASLLD